MTTKKEPNVISYKRHQEETSQLNAVISKYLGEIQELKLSLDSRACTIETLQKEKMELQKHIKTMDAEFSDAKGYWETNTKTLHDELQKYSLLVEELKTIAKDAQQIAKDSQQQLAIHTAEKKAKKKWYQIFS